MSSAKKKKLEPNQFWFLALLKNLANSSTKSVFDLAWYELGKELAAKGREKLLDWFDSSSHDIVISLDFLPSHWKNIKSTISCFNSQFWWVDYL
jgi:hypothetical protein